MNCPDCGHESPPGSLYCRGCRTLFPGDAIEGPPPDEDEAILVLAQGCELLLRGEWTLDEFRDWLNAFIEKRREREQQIMEVYQSIPPGLEEYFQEEVKLGFNGVIMCKGALTALGDFMPDKHDAEVLKTALLQFHRGTRTIREAMGINRRNRGEDDDAEGASVGAAESLEPPG